MAKKTVADVDVKGKLIHRGRMAVHEVRPDQSESAPYRVERGRFEVGKNKL